MFKKIGLVLMGLFYLFAGINHFIHPKFYLAIIPPYLSAPQFLNYLSGFLEIVFAILLYSPKTRKLSCWAIILMLIAFLPVHIDMIIKASQGNYVVGDTTITSTIAWGRIPFQLLFVAWAYWCSKMKFDLINK